MIHPAYADIFCEKHEKWHQEDICPLCYHEDAEAETCEEHKTSLVEGKCEICEERYNDRLSQRDLSQDWTTWPLLTTQKQDADEYAADERRAALKDERP